MTRVLLLMTLVLAAAALAVGLRSGPAAGQTAQDRQVASLEEGDIVKVEGAPIGCQVARRSGKLVLDCRRAGRLAGTYGTLFDKDRVRVVKFRSNRTAQVVYKARHRGAGRRCDRGARTSGKVGR